MIIHLFHMTEVQRLLYDFKFEVTLILTLYPCYKTDCLFAKLWGSQSFFRYTIYILNTQWTFCANLREKLRCVCVFLFICVLRKYLFCMQLFGKWARWGAITSILKHWKGYNSKTHPNFFLILADNFKCYYPRT